MVMERVQTLPTARIQSTVPDVVERVYRDMRDMGNGARVKALVHDKRTPLDQISRDLRLKGNIRTMVCIDSKDAAGVAETFALFAEWDDTQAPYKSPSRKRQRSEV